MEIVVMQAFRHDWLVSLHRSLELFPKELGPSRPGCFDRYEPLRCHEAEFVAGRFVDEYLRLGGIPHRPDQLRGEEMDAHAASRIVHRALTAARRVLHTTKGRQIAVVHGDDGITILVERGANRLELRREGDSGGSLTR